MKNKPPHTTDPEFTSEEDSSTVSERAGRAMELLAQVKSGTMPGSMLSPESRRSLVTLLTADGVTGPEIAQILQVSDRTVERDRREIRSAASISKDPKLVGEMVGRLMAEAELAVQRIRRTVRERDVDPGIRVDAEHRCFQIVKDLVHSLQSLGYLPTATHRLEADLTHHSAPIPAAEELLSEFERLKQIAPDDPALQSLDKTFTLAHLASALADHKDGVTAEPEDDEEDPDEESEDGDSPDEGEDDNESGEADDAEEGGHDETQA